MRWGSLVCFVVLSACSPTHQIGDDIDPCVGLDPDGMACALAWTALLDRDHCRYDRECRGLVLSDALCDAYHPAEGSWETSRAEANRVALAEGRVRFDPEGMRCVLRHSLRCDRPSTDEVIVCPPEWVATTTHADGDACDNRFECGAGMVCTDSRSTSCGERRGVCVTLASEGEACGPERACDIASLLTCVDERCVRITGIELTAVEGDACSVVTQREDGHWVDRRCADGYWCETRDSPSHCVRVGEPCGDRTCPDWMQCRLGVCEPSPTPRAGIACLPGGQGLCGWATFGLACDPLTRRCEETHRRMGDRCARGWIPCLEGVCRVAPPAFEGAPDEERCFPPLGAGGACIDDGECESLACCDGRCAG